MTINLMRQTIKQIFKYPFPFYVLQKVLKISNLKFSHYEEDMNNESFFFQLTSGNEWLLIAIAKNENDPEYENYIGIIDSSIEKIKHDLQIKGTFFNVGINFDHTIQRDMELLKKLLAKWENLSVRSR